MPSTKYRLSIPIEPEAYETFQRMAQVLGKSLGATISEWLTESAPQVEMITVAVAKAKDAPAAALRELQAIAEATQVRVSAAQREMTDLQRVVEVQPEPAPGRRGTAAARSTAAGPRRKAGGR